MRTPSPIVRFDPNATRDFSPLTIGTHLVRRSRLAGTNYTVYSTMVGDEVAGRQISYPEERDCARHVNSYHSHTAEGRQRLAMLDTELHDRIIGMLGTKELDARDLCRMFSKTSTVMAPVLNMLVTERRIIRRGTDRRPIFTAPLAQPQAH